MPGNSAFAPDSLRDATPGATTGDRPLNRAAAEAPLIFFDHLPKTGGTSVTAMLRARYGEHAVIPKVAGVRIEATRARYPAARILSGHFLLYPGDAPPEGFTAMTVLRDPVDRVVSEFFYRDDVMSPTRGARTRESAMRAFDAFVEAGGDGTIEISNFQARHLALYESLDGVCARDEELLPRATAALERFELVGTTEELDLLAAVLAWRWGWPSSLRVPIENRTSWRPALGEIAPRTLQRLRELNAVDLELHAIARRRLRESAAICLSEAVAGRTAPPPALSPVPAQAAPAQPAAAAPAPRREFGDRSIEIRSVVARGTISPDGFVMAGEMMRVAIELASHIDCQSLTVGLSIATPDGTVVYGTNSRLLGMELAFAANRTYAIEFEMRADLGPGEYRIAATIHTGFHHLSRCFHWLEHAAGLVVVGNIGAGFEGLAKLYPRLDARMLGTGQAPEGSPVLREIEGGAVTLVRSNAALETFSGRIRLVSPIGPVGANDAFSVVVEVTNTGEETWPSTGQRPVVACYHWLDADGAMLVFDGVRTPLPRDLPPDESARVTMAVQAPGRGDAWVLRITLLQEWVAWFDEKGAVLADCRVEARTG